MKKREEIISMIIDMFDRIGIEMPSNFDEIVNFIVGKTTNKDNCTDAEISFWFKCWIESKS